MQSSAQETHVSTLEQYNAHPMNHHIFGYLLPCLNNRLSRIDLYKALPEVKIGRAPDNDLVFDNVKISFNHCRIIWNGAEGDKSLVTVLDTSTNGTFVNGNMVGMGSSLILRDGNEIALASAVPHSDHEEDFRFIYRHLAGREHANPLKEKYDLGQVLGSGSFATVHLAVEKATGELWAVKTLRDIKSLGSTVEETIASFMREIAILESLNHPNVCRLKEVFMPFADLQDISLVLEFVEGNTLLNFISNHDGGLSEPLTIHFTRQICCAMEYVHSKGIVHRDLKPENILVTKENPPSVKIADFGLAKALDGLTMLKTSCGTQVYAAPEVSYRTDGGGYSHLVDSWSVGLIVFCMLAHRDPVFIVKPEITDVRRRIAERGLDWSSLDSIGISDECRHFIQRLLERDPTTRMSMAEARHHPWLAPPSHASQSSTAPHPFGQMMEELASYPDLYGTAGDIPMPPAADDLDYLDIPSSPVAGPSKGKGKQRESVLHMPGALPLDSVLSEPRNEELAREADSPFASPEPEVPIAGPSNPQKRGRRFPKAEPMDAIEEDMMEEERPTPKRNRRADDNAPPAATKVPPRKKNLRTGPAPPIATTRAAALGGEQDGQTLRRSSRTTAAKAARR
ncbi:Pkinase-domain-containing protein [Artomyces pyxidatus]|uniref:Pkinase-domain-containing protein n=1 Tax=Artomyces pyxidatus TaxID=48021 RepID=A0ACB8TAM7_9AGAM|nr:Pkinase-domain-containing protein [Artomyces pyxidatus]